jgi:riboflavin synthase
MFTGLIQEVGLVQKTEKRKIDLRLTVKAPRLSKILKTGDSLAVNGCCLTAVGVKPPHVSFEAVPETLRRTVLGSLKKGDLLNLEMPLTLAEPLGGHFVQGHVDGIAQILKLEPEGEGARLKIRLPSPLIPYVVEKGSIALDGISLTVASIHKAEVDVALIPHTLENTCLKAKKPGDFLQVEVDMLAKYLEKLAAGYLTQGRKP